MSEKKPALPPVVANVVLELSREEAFDAFTRGFGDWWPRSTHSIGESRTKSVHFEARVGGRIYEVVDDGTRHMWGEVLECEAPKRLVFSWHPGRPEDKKQRIEVHFAADGNLTHVELVHYDWEVFAERAEEKREGYVMGWAHVFGECFVRGAEEGGESQE
jgi:uncharacterized protein YndB with AHSA1/START domain